MSSGTLWGIPKNLLMGSNRASSPTAKSRFRSVSDLSEESRRIVSTYEKMGATKVLQSLFDDELTDSQIEAILQGFEKGILEERARYIKEMGLDLSAEEKRLIKVMGLTFDQYREASRLIDKRDGRS